MVVDPYDTKKFSLSSVALSKELHKVNDLDATLDATLLADKTPLIALGMQITPGAARRHAEVRSGNQQREQAADARHADIQQNQQRPFVGAEHGEQDDEDDEDRDRNNESKARLDRFSLSYSPDQPTV